MPERSLCRCGCGHLASPGKRYIHGHVGTGRTASAETRARMRAGKLGELNPMFGKVAHNRKEAVPPQPCACTCGELATPGRRYVTGHNSRGVRMERYRGWMRWHGYIQVDARDHPFSDKSGFVLEHRLVVEERLRHDDPTSPLLAKLGYKYYLRPDIVVHHVDGVKDNNAWGNLLPLTAEEHTRLHHEQGDIHHH